MFIGGELSGFGISPFAIFLTFSIFILFASNIKNKNIFLFLFISLTSILFLAFVCISVFYGQYFTLFKDILAFDKRALLMISLTLFSLFFINLMSFDEIKKQGQLGIHYLCLTPIMSALAVVVITSTNLLALTLALKMFSILIMFFKRKENTSSIKNVFIQKSIFFALSLFALTLIYKTSQTLYIEEIIISIIEGQNHQTLFYLGFLLFSLFLLLTLEILPIKSNVKAEEETSQLTLSLQNIILPIVIFSAIFNVSGIVFSLNSVSNETISAGRFIVFIFIAIAIIAGLINAYLLLKEKNLKLIFSRLSKLYYIFIFFSLFSANPAKTSAFLLSAYVIMSLSFIAYLNYAIVKHKDLTLNSLKGKAKSEKIISALFIFSVAAFMALPPLLGFWAKYRMLVSLIQRKAHFIFAVSFLLILFIAYYLINLIIKLFKSENENDYKNEEKAYFPLISLSALSLIILLLSIFNNFISHLL